MTTSAPGRVAPFLLLSSVFGDAATAEAFSERATVEGWLRVERELALASADVGLISREDATAIAAAAVFETIDVDDLWVETRNVGYPILPLVRQIARALPPGPGGKVHLGATTQDIMDTAVALQLRTAVTRHHELVAELGDALAQLMETHVDTIMPARTHGQHAVPTTFGAKLAVYLVQLVDLERRLITTSANIALVSLHGAGGTSASWGSLAVPLRSCLGRRLALEDLVVPWHTARQRIVDLGLSLIMLASFAARLAREIVTLSRTEIAELAEPGGWHKGASSTMPQKVNPTLSEATVGMAAAAQSLAPALLRCIEAEHERSAGEWQIEWDVMPTVCCLAAGALANMVEVMRGVRVSTEHMSAHLEDDSSLIMSEAYMMSASVSLGRERAHDALYELAAQARARGDSIHDVVAEHVDELWPDGGHVRIEPAGYLGDPHRVCATARRVWRDRPSVQRGGSATSVAAQVGASARGPR